MSFVHRLAAALVGAAALAVPQPSAAAPTVMLTNVKPASLQIIGLPPHGTYLRGMLQRTTTCNTVAFQRSPARIVPPIYRAVQISTPGRACAQIVQWVLASVKVPNLIRAVTVQAKNGSFKVPR
jgi:hypothetical protein